MTCPASSSQVRPAGSVRSVSPDGRRVRFLRAMTGLLEQRGVRSDHPAAATCRGSVRSLCASCEAGGCHPGPVRVVADVLVALVALLHAFFLVLEMFLW